MINWNGLVQIPKIAIIFSINQLHVHCFCVLALCKSLHNCPLRCVFETKLSDEDQWFPCSMLRMNDICNFLFIDELSAFLI